MKMMCGYLNTVSIVEVRKIDKWYNIIKLNILSVPKI